MKQRLAIAATLLKQPDLLILDEPTNGLDPAGIREIRETIRDLGESGVTVLLSSHILAEVQQVCTSATIIGNGRLLASGPVDELVGVSTAYRVGAPDPEAARQVLTEAGFTVGDGLLVETDRPADVTQALGAAGIWLTELTPVRRDLEAVFLELTAERHAGRGRLMRRLTGVELTRLRWRRAVLLLLLIAVAVPVVIGVARVWSTRPVSDSEIARAAENGASEIARCADRPRQFGLPPGRHRAAVHRPDRQLVHRPREAQPGQRAHRRLRHRRGRGPHRSAAPGRHHVRRPRLEQRLDEQPAAVRAETWADLDRQGAGGHPDGAADRGRRQHGVLARHLGDDEGRATCRSSRARSPTPSSTGCAAPASRPLPRSAATP